jgi:hypothetical protein
VLPSRIRPPGEKDGIVRFPLLTAGVGAVGPARAITTRSRPLAAREESLDPTIRLSHSTDRIRGRGHHRKLLGRLARPAVLGAIALVAIVAVAVAACGGSTGSGSGTSQSSSFKTCLEQHGVTLPQGGAPGGGAGGSGAAHPRPTGSAASSFQKAIQACGGSSGFRPGSAG